jgi:hypothetical protein
MKTVPVMSYHVLVGVIGAAILISYAVLVIWRDWRSATIRVAATACIWGLLFYGALARPRMLSHLAAQAGLGSGLYPDPMTSLLQMTGRTREKALGGVAYQLMRRPPGLTDEATLPPIDNDRPALSIAAPDLLTTWTRGRNVEVMQAAGGYVVTGNEEGGYLVTSPVIPVPPHSRLVVHAQGRVYRGHVCLGVLDKGRQWLLPPEPGVPERSVDTGNNDAVSLVISTCALGDLLPAKFIVKSVSYAILPSPGEAGR